MFNFFEIQYTHNFYTNGSHLAAKDPKIRSLTLDAFPLSPELETLPFCLIDTPNTARPK